MTDNTREILKSHGFAYDKENVKLKNVLKNNSYFKELYIDIYPQDPLNVSSETYMLLLRTSEKNAIVINDGNRIILKKNDKYKTHILNILSSKITECFFKFSNSCLEFVFKIQNVFYRLTVLN